MEKKYNETYDQEIDRYIIKKMDSDAAAGFEQLMATDPALLEEVTFRKGLLKAIKWKRQINIAHTEMVKSKTNSPLEITSKVNVVQQETTIRRIGLRKVLAYAASVSILALIGLSWYANNNFSDRYLADTNTNELVSLDDNNLKGGGNTSKDPFDQGLYYLKEKEYTQAASFFETIPNQDDAYVQARLYLAFSQYHIKSFDNAIANANIVQQESFDTKDKQKAEWLIIQALLKQGKKDTNFFNQLKVIADSPNHIYQKRAKTLQVDLDSFWRKLVL